MTIQDFFCELVGGGIRRNVISIERRDLDLQQYDFQIEKKTLFFLYLLQFQNKCCKIRQMSQRKAKNSNFFKVTNFFFRIWKESSFSSIRFELKSYKFCCVTEMVTSCTVKRDIFLFPWKGRDTSNFPTVKIFNFYLKIKIGLKNVD